MNTRARILEIARAEMGPQEKGSVRVYEYWRDVLPPSWPDAQVAQYAKTKEWCGCFALWCLRQAGIAQDVYWHDGLGFLAGAHLHTTQSPQQGDVGYVPAPFQHHFLFDHIDTDGWIHSVDGNQPDVREKRRLRHGVMFYSIAPLLPREPDTEPAPLVVSMVTLRKGSTDRSSVELLQRLLNQHGATLTVDGSFGPKTEAFVRAFQTSSELVPDGVVGEKTWDALVKP